MAIFQLFRCLTLRRYFSISCALFFVFSCTHRRSTNREQFIFRYNEHANVSSLDPAFSRTQANNWLMNQLFNGLVQLDDSLRIRPAIAKSWTISDDGTTYSFLLRKDVYFHPHPLFNTVDSTRTVVAADIEFSLNRLLDERLASPGKWVMNSVRGFHTLNDSTFSIQLRQPFPAFLGLLATPYCSIVPREAVLYFGERFRAHPIGTGPFRFKRWEENVKLVLRKNPLYFEKDETGRSLPYLEAVAITFLPDKQGEFLQFIQGKLDFLNSLDASYKDELLTPDGALQPGYRNKINFLSSPYLNTEYLGIFMETEVPALQSETFRKALNYGFDRRKMMTYLRNNIGAPAEHGFISKGLPGYTGLKGYTYQSEKARTLLNQFKSETGIAQPQITITTDGNYVDLCEYIQSEWQKIGISVTIDAVPAATLRQSKATGKLPLFRASWIADYPDAENYLSLFYSKNFAPEGPNYTHFRDAQFDAWYEAAMRETDTDKRVALYARMDSLLISKAPIIPLYYDQIIRFTQKNVYGLGGNPINLLTLKRVWKK